MVNHCQESTAEQNDVTNALSKIENELTTLAATGYNRAVVGLLNDCLARLQPANENCDGCQLSSKQLASCFYDGVAAYQMGHLFEQGQILPEGQRQAWQHGWLQTAWQCARYASELQDLYSDAKSHAVTMEQLENIIAQRLKQQKLGFHEYRRLGDILTKVIAMREKFERIGKEK